MKATEYYFPVVLFDIMLYKMVLAFESVHKILKQYCARRCLFVDFCKTKFVFCLVSISPTFRNIRANKKANIPSVALYCFPPRE